MKNLIIATFILIGTFSAAYSYVFFDSDCETIALSAQVQILNHFEESEKLLKIDYPSNPEYWKAPEKVQKNHLLKLIITLMYISLFVRAANAPAIKICLFRQYQYLKKF